MSTTAISTIRPVPEHHGLRNAVVAFVVAAALGLGVAGGFALDSDSSSSRSVAPTATEPAAHLGTPDSIDRAASPASASSFGSADSAERQTQPGSQVGTDNGCRLPDSRMPC